MAQNKPKRPWAVKQRTPPPDAASLEMVIRKLSKEIRQKARHLKGPNGHHDTRVRTQFRILHDQRSAALARLVEVDPERALRLCTLQGLAGLNVPTEQEVSP